MFVITCITDATERRLTTKYATQTAAIVAAVQKAYDAARHIPNDPIIDQTGDTTVSVLIGVYKIVSYRVEPVN